MAARAKRLSTMQRRVRSVENPVARNQCREFRVAPATAKPRRVCPAREANAGTPPSSATTASRLPLPGPCCQMATQRPNWFFANDAIWRQEQRPTALALQPARTLRDRQSADGRTSATNGNRRAVRPRPILGLKTRDTHALRDLSRSLLFHSARLFHSDCGDEPCALHRLAPAWRRGTRNPCLSCGRPRSASVCCRRRSPAPRARHGRTISSAACPAFACYLCAVPSSAVAASWAAAASRLCAAFPSIGAFRSSIAFRLDPVSRSARGNAAVR
jgi:hypothetical protein